MTGIHDLLSRALLVRERTVPQDVVRANTARTLASSLDEAGLTPPHPAAEDLHALCETLVLHTPNSEVADFVTEQVPEPRSALILACVLHLTETAEGARFWWEYAAGAGQPAAAYCLYLHHLALGERDAADWWHQQTDDVQPPPAPTEQEEASARPGNQLVANSSISTILRVLRHLGKHSNRPRSAAVTELMAYVPTAVAVGYLREPDMDLPMPGDDFADHIVTLLETAGAEPDIPSTDLPARNAAERSTDDFHGGADQHDAEQSQGRFQPWGQTATR